MLEVAGVGVAEGHAALEDDAGEGLYDPGVELGAGDAVEFGEGGFGADGPPVGVARGHHVVGVCGGDDAGAEGDLLARDARGVAAAAEALVVIEDDLGHGAVALDALHEFGALLGVELDQLPFLVRELAIREQDGVGKDELADVVQQRGRVDQVVLALGQPQHLGDVAGVARDGSGVAGGHGVAHRERLHDGGKDADLQRAEFLGALGELHTALVGLDPRAREVMEDEEDHGQQVTAAMPSWA